MMSSSTLLVVLLPTLLQANTIKKTMIAHGVVVFLFVGKKKGTTKDREKKMMTPLLSSSS
jgi:hypothetical protein